MNVTDFVILALIVWRLSSLFVFERGAWDVCVQVRRAVGIGHDEEGKPVTYPDTQWAQLFSCVWCLSIWIGVVVSIAYLLWPMITLWILMPFALSAGAILIDKVAANGKG